MSFEKCPHCTQVWQSIDPETLCRELDAAGLPGRKMLDFMAVRPEVVETNTAQYRKYIPSKIKDWARA